MKIVIEFARNVFYLSENRESLRPKLKKTIKKNYPRQSTLGARQFTLDPRQYTLDPRHSTLDPRQKPTLEKHLFS